MNRILLINLLIIGALTGKETLRIAPYAQWTFNEPFSRVIYREDTEGFPIALLEYPSDIHVYDSLGVHISSVTKYPNESFILNPGNTYFMLSGRTEQTFSVPPNYLLSCRIYDVRGKARYIYADRYEQSIHYPVVELTNTGSLLITDISSSWLTEIRGEDTLLTMDLRQKIEPEIPVQGVHALRYGNDNSLMTVATILPQSKEEDYGARLDFWDDSLRSIGNVVLPGKVLDVYPVPGTHYYLINYEYQDQSVLELFSQAERLARFPWHSWKIQSVDETMIFIISEKALNVISLGDGSIAASIEPSEFAQLGDAIYMSKWGLFVYLRAEQFYQEDGTQAFRDFELEAVDNTGRIVYRSSFGTWSPELPKLAIVNDDRFGIHIYNGILIYQVQEIVD